MMKWLDAVRWYSLSAIQPVVSIEIEQAPVVQTHWNLVRKDESLFRFGLLWACFDRIGILGIYFCPGILPHGNCPITYLYGGIDGTSFLVQACGLEQPHAGRGVVRFSNLRSNRRYGLFNFVAVAEELY